MSKSSSKAGAKPHYVADPPASLRESIANIRAYAIKLLDDDAQKRIKDGKRQCWRLLELLFPLEFYTFTGATAPLALQKAKPKTKWEIERAAKLEREALALLTPEQLAQFAEDEAELRRAKEAAESLRKDTVAARKRKADAIEEAKVLLAESNAKAQREALERKRPRVEPGPVCATSGNTAKVETLPFVTPSGHPVLSGDLYEVEKRI